jgi:hypothetical protein
MNPDGTYKDFDIYAVQAESDEEWWVAAAYLGHGIEFATGEGATKAEAIQAVKDKLKEIEKQD